MVLSHMHYDLIHRDYYTRDNFPNYYWISACDVSIKVKNTDDVGGNFWVTLYVTTSTGFYEYTTDSVFFKAEIAMNLLVHSKVITILLLMKYIEQKKK